LIDFKVPQECPYMTNKIHVFSSVNSFDNLLTLYIFYLNNMKFELSIKRLLYP